MKGLLDGLGLASFPKTSGGKGFHVLVPLDRRSTYDDTRAFAEHIAGAIAAGYPKLATTAWAKSKRRGVLIDANQNGMGKTIASVYSVRPHPGAPVSTPLRWDEVNEKLDPHAFTMGAVLDRVARHGDLFEGVLTTRQSLAQGAAAPSDSSARERVRREPAASGAGREDAAAVAAAETARFLPRGRDVEDVELRASEGAARRACDAATSTIPASSPPGVYLRTAEPSQSATQIQPSASTVRPSGWPSLGSIAATCLRPEIVPAESVEVERLEELRRRVDVVHDGVVGAPADPVRDRDPRQHRRELAVR